MDRDLGMSSFALYEKQNPCPKKECVEESFHREPALLLVAHGAMPHGLATNGIGFHLAGGQLHLFP